MHFKMAHVCDTCGASFVKASRLLVHQRTHTGERPFKCPCGRSYIRRQHLTRHSTTCACTLTEPRKSLIPSPKNIEAPSYFCPTCPAGPFTKKKSVWAHRAIVHGERRFKCEKCDAAFTTNSKLERHCSRHHDLKCEICAQILSYPELQEKSYTFSNANLPDPNERFENFNALRRHIADKHPTRKFICSECGQHFARLAHLRTHEESHIPVEERRRAARHVCPHCSAPPVESVGASEGDGAPPVAFASKQGLAAHIRAVHAPCVRRFPCPRPECPAILSTRQKLENHLKRHEKASGLDVIRVIQKAPRKRRVHQDVDSACSSPNPEKTKRRKGGVDGEGSASPPKTKWRRKCVPLCDLQEAWETDSQSSILGLLC